MARLTSVASWLGNFGKSIGYSAKDILAEAAPNTSKIVEDASDEIYKFRDFMSDYKSKGKVVDKYLNFTELQKQANDIITGTISDIKTGNFAAPKDSFDDMFGGDDFDFGSDDYTDAEDQDEEGAEVRKLNLSTDAKATAKATIQGNTMIAETLEKASKAQMMAQVNTAKAIMNTTNNIGMIAVNKLGASLTETNRRLDQINANLVEMLKFMNENQSKVNQAQLDYLNSAKEYMKIQLNMLDPKRKKVKKSAKDDFLAGGEFNLPSYIGVVKENLKNNSSVSQIQAMLGMGSMMGGMMGSMGGAGSMIRPTQMLMNMAMRKFIPKKVQKAITKADDLIPKALMGGLSTLSDMRDNVGIRGLIGSIFGAGARQQKSFRLGNYEKGAVPWDGKSKRALEVVIPHYLALIESHTSNIPKRKGGTGPSFYDYDTGTFKSKEAIRDRLKERTSDAFRGASYDSTSFFEEKFSEDPDMQDNAKQLMWKHLQPMVFGDRKLEGEENVTKAAKAYAKDLEKLGLNPAEISKLVIYFKGSVTKLRQYMMQFQLTESEQELFNERETDGFGFIKGGFKASDLGTNYSKTDVYRKQQRDKAKADQAEEELKEILERAKGTILPTDKEKNRLGQNLRYLASEGIGTIHGRNTAATNIEAGGLTLVNYLAGMGELDTSGGLKSAAASIKKSFGKYKYDHLSVADVMQIMRKCKYNTDQYDYITADDSGDKDGLFGLAVLKLRYGRPGCLRVITPRNIIYDSESKQYKIMVVDTNEPIVTSRDGDKDFQPPDGAHIYPMGKSGFARTGAQQKEMDANFIEENGPLEKRPEDKRTFTQKAKDAVTKVVTGTNSYEEKLKKDAAERKAAAEAAKNPDSGEEKLGGAGGRSKKKRRKYEAKAFTQRQKQSGSNTNEASEEKGNQKRRRINTQNASINMALDELNKAADTIKDHVAGDKSKEGLWNKIKSKIGMNKRAAKGLAAGGILGALLLPGGPIGGAIIGAAVGIASTGFDFKRMLFGSKTVDEDGTIHYEKTGIVGQWQNTLQTAGKDLLKTSFDSAKSEIAAYAKAQFAPVFAALRSPDGRSLIPKTMVETIQDVGKNVIQAITNPMETLNKGLIKITSSLLSTSIRAGRSVITTTAKAGTWLIAKPAQLIADTIAASRGGKNPFQFIKNVASAGIERGKARIGAKAGYYFSKGGVLSGLAQGAKDAKNTRGGLIHRASVFKQGIRKNKSDFFSGKYEDEKAKLDEIRENLKSDDPYTRQYAMEQLLPKDKNGMVKDPAWNQMKDENGLIDPAALDQYMQQNANKFINFKEQALAGLAGEKNYQKTVDENRRKDKLQRTLIKLSAKDGGAYNPNMSDREAKKRQQLIEKYISRDEKGNINDELYLKIKRDKDGNLDKEDLDKFIKNKEAFQKEVEERERIEKEKAEAERLKQEDENMKRNQNAFQLSQLIAATGADFDTSLIDNSKDNSASIIAATVAAVKQKAERILKQQEDEEDEEKEKAEDAANEAQDQAVIARSKKDKEKRAEAEVTAENKRKESRAKEAEETAQIQSQGQNKVEDNAEDEEEDNTATIADTGAIKEEEEEESGIGSILKKAGLAIGGITTVAALLNSEAGKKLISTLGSVIGGALKNIGSSIIDWVKNGLGDLAGNIVDGVKGLFGTDTKENTKEMKAEDLAELNPDYVSDGDVVVDENGNEIVKVNVNTGTKNILGNTARRAVTQAAAAGLSPGYAKAVSKVGGGIINAGKATGKFLWDHKGTIAKGAKMVGKGALWVADKATNLIPGVKTLKKTVKAAGWVGDKAGKGANWISKALSGKTIGENIKDGAKALGEKAINKGKDLVGKAKTAIPELASKAATKVKTTASTVASKVVNSKTGNTVLTKLQSIISSIKDMLSKFAKCKQLQSLLKKVKGSTLVKKMEELITKITTKLTNVVKSGKDKSLNKVINEAAERILGGTVGQAIKTATVVVSGIWSAATGALDAANLFMVNEDDVDLGMRTVSAIINLLVDFIPVAGPIFDFVSTISEALGFPNFKRELAEVIYNVIYTVTGGASKGVATLEQKQSEYEKEYEQYLKDHGLSKEDLSITEYNDIVNQTIGDKVVNTVQNGLKQAGSWLSGIFGGKKKEEEEEESMGSGTGSEGNTSSASVNKSVKEKEKSIKKNTKKAKTSNSALQNGTGSLGFGPGMAQDDPSYASVNLGKLPDGSTATMKNSGCGPTALANAVAATGGDANPGEVGRYARRNGMLTDGGANSKLFTEGARKYGMKGTEIGSMDSLNASLDSGNPVIVSGKSMGYGPGCENGTCHPSNLYTKAGHIVTVTSRNGDGTYNVDDGEGESVVSGDVLQNGATKAFSMERLGGAVQRGVSVTDGKQKAAENNVVQDNGTTIQHGAYYFAQNDPQWANIGLKGWDTTIGKAGCVHTSGAMAASTILGSPIDPGTFMNTYNNAATISNLQKPGVKVTRYPASGSMNAGTVDGTPHLPTIIDALKQRKMVMMYGEGTDTNMYKFGQGGPHCVLATGLDKDGNIIILDPYSPNPPYGQASTTLTAWPPVSDSINPMYWAQVVETPDGKGASGQLDPNVSAGMTVAAGSDASGSGSSSATATSGASGSTSGTGVNTTGAEGEEGESSGNVLNAIFGAMSNIISTVGNRLTTSVFTGKSYQQVKAEEEANAATSESVTTDASAATGYGPGGSFNEGKEPSEKLLESYPGKTMEEKKLAYYQRKVAMKKAQEKIPNNEANKDLPVLGRGPEDFGTVEDTGDKLDQMILLLTDIRTNTGNIAGSTGALGGAPAKSKDTGKNTIASKQGNKTDTQRKQNAKDAAKSKLSTLNNGLKSDSLGRGKLRSNYAKIGAF